MNKLDNIDDQTIAAISTPLGMGGIAVIRVSGKNSHKLVKEIFSFSYRSNLEERKLYYGNIVNPDTNEKIDSGLCVFMSEPNTYTGEDIAEIHCHGGYVVPNKILELIMSIGAIPAEPGEFTKRAFLNGKMDLAQSEAVIDIINAQTEKSLKIAEDQLEGKLSKKINELKDSLLDNLALVEAQVDFPEEDIDPIVKKNLLISSAHIKTEINDLLNTYNKGKIFKDGLNTAIIGKPNVGKSSLLNCLLNKERAIVSSVPGTTRDFIEEIIDVKGIPIKIIDTAGIRKTFDKIESVGIELASKKASDSELIVLVFDQSNKLDEDDLEIIQKTDGKKYIAVLNKADIKRDFDTTELKKSIPEDLIVEISAKKADGIDDLLNKIYDIAIGDNNNIESSEIVLTNLRQKNSIDSALKYLDQFVILLQSDESPEILSIELRSSMDCLGEITGEITTEDLLGRIFSKFCIGK